VKSRSSADAYRGLTIRETTARYPFDHTPRLIACSTGKLLAHVLPRPGRRDSRDNRLRDMVLDQQGHHSCSTSPTRDGRIADKRLTNEITEST